MRCSHDDECLIFSPPSYRVGLLDAEGQVTSKGHSVLHSQPPIYEDFPHILQPPPLPRRFCVVHWCDGEQSELNALDSEDFKPFVDELELRLCKHNAKRSGEEQWLDVSKSFVIGHTLTKRETHKDRPRSPFIKEDFDRALTAHGVTLESKHYAPLLSFLEQAPYILQQAFAPNVVQTGVEAHGGYPPNFAVQASGCEGFMNLPDSQAQEILEHVPKLIDTCYYEGRLTEVLLDESKAPDDASGLRRNDLGTFNRERATWYNNEGETKRRRDLRQAELDLVTQKADEARLKAANAQLKLKEKEEKKLQRVAKSKLSKEKKEVNDQRIAMRKALHEGDQYCYCKETTEETEAKAKQQGQTVISLACGGEGKCPLRKWVHHPCAKENNDIVTPAMVTGDDVFWCSYCAKHFKN